MSGSQAAKRTNAATAHMRHGRRNQSAIATIANSICWNVTGGTYAGRPLNPSGVA